MVDSTWFKWLSVAAAIFSVLSGITLVGGWYWDLWTTAPPTRAFLGGLGTGLLVIPLLVWLFRSFPKNPIKKVIGNVWATNHDGTTRTLDVRLVTRNPNRRLGGEKVQFSWATVMTGAEQLRDYVSQGNAQVATVIGMNTTGVFLATYIAKQLAIPRERVGAIFTSGRLADGKRNLRMALPTKKELLGTATQFSQKILLVDSELKTGASVSQVYEELKTRYECLDENIWYAVLVACGIDTSGVTIAKARPDAKGSIELSNLFLVETNYFVKQEVERQKSLRSERANEETENLPKVVEHVPHYVVFFTPRGVEMPGEVY